MQGNSWDWRSPPCMDMTSAGKWRQFDPNWNQWVFASNNIWILVQPVFQTKSTFLVWIFRTEALAIMVEDSNFLNLLEFIKGTLVCLLCRPWSNHTEQPPFANIRKTVKGVETLSVTPGNVEYSHLIKLTPYVLKLCRTTRHCSSVEVISIKS